MSTHQMKLRVLNIIEVLAKGEEELLEVALLFEIFSGWKYLQRSLSWQLHSWSYKNMTAHTWLGGKPGGDVKHMTLARRPSVNVWEVEWSRFMYPDFGARWPGLKAWPPQKQTNKNNKNLTLPPTSCGLGQIFLFSVLKYIWHKNLPFKLF